MLFSLPLLFTFFFFFNDTATTEIYTLSLHDALPISRGANRSGLGHLGPVDFPHARLPVRITSRRSEEHTSELQSRRDLVCRLLLEKKKKNNKNKQLIQLQRTNTLSINHTLVCHIPLL